MREILPRLLERGPGPTSSVTNAVSRSRWAFVAGGSPVSVMYHRRGLTALGRTVISAMEAMIGSSARIGPGPW